ncbi:NUDIX domain-containing protein [Nanohaloarchaea archaeon]|nr:NUDIX domain-containing protein [Candidatus Nanohaloarchaea archaeon]
MDKTIAAVKALIEKEGEYLFVGVEYGDGTIWVPPGGKVERGESPIQALNREVQSETSLKIEPGRPIGMYHFLKGEKDRGDQVTLTLFETNKVYGNVDIETDHAKEDGITDYRWMSPEQITKNNVTDTLRQLLEQEIF